VKQCPRPADRVQLGARIAARMHRAGGFIAPAGRPDRWAIYARPVDRWAVPGGSLGADRGPRIACAGPFPADRWAIASRSCARWAVPGHRFGDKRARPAGRILRVFHWA